MSSSRIGLALVLTLLAACQGVKAPPAAVATAGPFVAASHPAVTPRVAPPEAGPRLYPAI